MPDVQEAKCFKFTIQIFKFGAKPISLRAYFATPPPPPISVYALGPSELI